jgi:hypothetical protein
VRSTRPPARRHEVEWNRAHQLGHGLVTEHQNVPCFTVLSKAVDSLGFSTLRAGRFCCSALRAFRNQQVLGSIPSAGSKRLKRPRDTKRRGVGAIPDDLVGGLSRTFPSRVRPFPWWERSLQQHVPAACSVNRAGAPCL